MKPSDELGEREIMTKCLSRLVLASIRRFLCFDFHKGNNFEIVLPLLFSSPPPVYEEVLPDSRIAHTKSIKIFVLNLL
jgi:hypothetical protein